MDSMPMKRFYSKRYYPQRDGERFLIDGVVVVAREKDKDIIRKADGKMAFSKSMEMERCDKCFFHTFYCGCGLMLDNLGCFDIMKNRRFYFEKEKGNGEEEADGREEAESI